MNIERFHNELALHLGYERIVKDKRILISVEESDDPWVVLKVQEYVDIRFKASEEIVEEMMPVMNPEMRDEIKRISDAVHYAYVESTRAPYSYFIKQKGT